MRRVVADDVLLLHLPHSCERIRFLDILGYSGEHLCYVCIGFYLLPLFGYLLTVAVSPFHNHALVIFVCLDFSIAFHHHCLRRTLAVSAFGCEESLDVWIGLWWQLNEQEAFVAYRLVVFVGMGCKLSTGFACHCCSLPKTLEVVGCLCY